MEEEFTINKLKEHYFSIDYKIEQEENKMEELKEKLAKFARFKSICAKSKPFEWLWWLSPQGERLRELPNFPESLDACFKGLVPKLKSLLDRETARIRLEYSQRKEGEWLFYFEDYIPHSHHYAYGETPALALCKAIEKLIDGAGKDV